MGIKGKVDKMVVLACEDCKERNYTTTKNKKNIKERLELKKYCPVCKKHTAHKETWNVPSPAIANWTGILSSAVTASSTLPATAAVLWPL